AYPEPPMYPEAPSYAPRSTRPTAPISIPSPNSNLGTVPQFPNTTSRNSCNTHFKFHYLLLLRRLVAGRSSSSFSSASDRNCNGNPIIAYIIFQPSIVQQPVISPRLSDGICSWISNEHACFKHLRLRAVLEQTLMLLFQTSRTGYQQLTSEHRFPTGAQGPFPGHRNGIANDQRSRLGMPTHGDRKLPQEHQPPRGILA
uniref:Ovule protein n=1 Tax=Haemonchus contortus TaxID=6289 RepID=A0A7I4YXY2_HAECO